MISKSLGVGLLAAGCLVAAGGGAYLATRSNAADAVRAQQAPTVPAQPAAPQPVSESEGFVGTPASKPVDAGTVQPAQPEAAPPAATPRKSEPPARARSVENARRTESASTPRTQSAPAATRTTIPQQVPSGPAAMPERPAAGDQGSVATPQAEAPAPDLQRAPEPTPPPVPERQEVVVPSASVIGLQVETTVSSERARVEDRVQARVTRDVMAGDRIAIPAGSRVLGTVTAVDRGGKIKERARLDVRFHTLVLADGTEVPMRTETISRFGESPTGDSARKIGGAAVGGAILGAIMGGGKGAMIGGATGAAGGTAVVMAGDRNAATLPAGTVLSVRLANPVSIEVER